MPFAFYLLPFFYRWLFLGTLIYAPWAYGCTEPEAISGLNLLLAAVIALWTLDLAVRGTAPVLPRPLCLLAAGLLTLGWAMALNASALYDPYFNEASALLKPFPTLPGAADGALSIAFMGRITLCMGGTLFVADLVRRPIWLLRLWWTLGLAGSSIALLGLAQKVTGAPMIFWQPVDLPVTSFFATYYYHANGGAFLNLTLPFAGCLALRALGEGGTPGQRILWITAFVCMLAASAVNTSRGAQIIALVLCIALATWPARGLLAEAWQSNRRVSAAMAGLGVVMAVIIVLSTGIEASLKRWRTSLNSPGFRDDRGRWLAQGVGLQAVPDAGWLGFGPGTFRVVFPYYTAPLGNRVGGVWKHQHEDYIQTAIEWGWLGAALWATLYFGGVVEALRAYRRHGAAWSSRRRLLLAAAVLALSGMAIHSLADFPMQIASLELLAAVCLGICWSARGWIAVER